jgi:hypothetical protein
MSSAWGAVRYRTEFCSARREGRSAEVLLPREPVAGIRGVKPANGPSRKLTWAVCIGSMGSSTFMRCWEGWPWTMTCR